MATAKLNYTGRKKIESRHAKIVVHREGAERRRFSAALELASYQFQSDARVVVEAYRQTTVMRFDFGTVSLLRPPPSCELGDFDSEDAILFRVLVTDTSLRYGMLLGAIDQIRPTDPAEPDEDRKSLLPVEPGDLGEQVWRLEFGAEVVLQVNRALPDWRQTVMSPNFKALVYPSIVRQVLTRILILDEYDDDDDPDNWRSNWLTFAKRIPGVPSPIPAESDEREEWIESVSAALALNCSLKTIFEAEIND